MEISKKIAGDIIRKKPYNLEKGKNIYKYNLHKRYRPSN